MFEILKYYTVAQIETLNKLQKLRELQKLQKLSQTFALCAAVGLESREICWMHQLAAHFLVGLVAFDCLHRMLTSKMRPNFV
jgi:hypothetical protein